MTHLRRSVRYATASALLVSLVTALVGGCQWSEQGAQVSPASPGGVSAQEAPAVLRPERIVSVTGDVLPKTWAVLSFGVSGTLKEVLVEEGQELAAGDLLARLDLPELDAAVSQAEAVLDVARAQLARLEAPARAEEVRIAQLAVEMTEEGLVAAEIAADTARANVDGAAAIFASAEASLRRLKAGATADELEVARLEVERAKALLYSVQGQRDAAGGRRDKSGYVAGSYEAAEGQVMAGETAIAIAELSRRILIAGARPEEIAGAEAQVRQAKAGLDAARAQERAQRQQETMQALQVRQAKAQLELVQAGARDEDIKVTRAQLKQAETALSAAQAAANKAHLRAPFSGTVTEIGVRAGEYVMMGSPAIAMGQIASFRVEITDLDEIDVARIREGSRAKLTFDALPDVELAGVVQSIALKASSGGGGTAYKTIISFDDRDPSLRWGMTAFADIETE